LNTVNKGAEMTLGRRLLHAPAAFFNLLILSLRCYLLVTWGHAVHQHIKFQHNWATLPCTTGFLIL